MLKEEFISMREKMEGEERVKMSSSIDAISQLFRECLAVSRLYLVTGELNEVKNEHIESAREAMKFFKAAGMDNIPEEISDEAVKTFALEFGKEIIFS